MLTCLSSFIALWNTFPPHDNFGILPTVHKQAILDIAYSLDSEAVYSVSGLLLLFLSFVYQADRVGP